MVNRWLYTKMWQYFDYDTNAIFINSEEIAKLPEEEKKEVYSSIASRMENYIVSLLPTPDILYQYVGIIFNDIYRTMNRAMYYTQKQTDYLTATAGVVTGTLLNHNIAVHFGSNNSFANVLAVKLLCSAMWEDCGFCPVDVYTIAEKLEQRTLTTHEELVQAYETNKAEVLLVANKVIKQLNDAGRSYAIMIPHGKEEEFKLLLDTVGKPGCMNLLKCVDAESSKIMTFDYIPPTRG